MSKRVLLTLLLIASWVSCFTAEKSFNEPRSLAHKKGNEKEEEKTSAEGMRLRLQKLLSALIQLKAKVEKKFPAKLDQLQKNIRRVEILLKKIKISPNFVKQKELNQVRKDIQDLIVEVRQGLIGKEEKKNKKEENPLSPKESIKTEESHSNDPVKKDNISEEASPVPIRLDHELAKRSQNDKVYVSEVKEELQNLSENVQTLQKEWKVLLDKIEETDSFLAQCMKKNVSSCLAAIHKQLSDDLALIYDRANESIYRVKSVYDEITFFLSNERSTISKNLLRKLRADLQLEWNDFQKSKDRLEGFLLAQRRLPDWFLIGDEPPSEEVEDKKPTDNFSYKSPLKPVERPSLEKQTHEHSTPTEVEPASENLLAEKSIEPTQRTDEDKQQSPEPKDKKDNIEEKASDLKQQEKIDVLRKSFKQFSNQHKGFKERFRKLQSFDPAIHLLKELKQEMNEAEDELKEFRTCLEKRLEEFLLNGKMNNKKLSKVHQKKLVAGRKLAKLKQIFIFLEEENDLHPKEIQIKGLHLVKKGESACTLAQKYDVSVENILHANPKQSEPFQEGDLISIPVPRDDKKSCKNLIKKSR
ncbi:LysM peptidoglycan-binding domain-containing protein [Candidatus Similichlamydia epinepheli]|uniref:LysM peptidoglycan-binding domain-containing protein n=1 Tax=Candidatus Similichlamydia epinepheli TaxID=1903953 RepID=UPI0013003576|nr:LysM domain-containing protein [Candidatus Similichlamydia epinepheli]